MAVEGFSHTKKEKVYTNPKEIHHIAGPKKRWLGWRTYEKPSKVVSYTTEDTRKQHHILRNQET